MNIEKEDLNIKILSSKDLNGLSKTQILNLIESTSKSIEIDPQKTVNFLFYQTSQQIRHIQSLLNISHYNDESLKLISIIALSDIFIKICPLYQINKNENQKKLKDSLVKKEEIQILKYEIYLLEFYSKYLSQINLYLQERASQQDKCKIIIECLANLLQNLSHFNFSNIILSIMIKQLQKFYKNDMHQKGIASLKNVIKINTIQNNELKIQLVKQLKELFIKKKGKVFRGYFGVINNLELYKCQQQQLQPLQMNKKKNKKQHKKQQEKYFNQLIKQKPQNKEIAISNNKILEDLFSIYFYILQNNSLHFYFNEMLEGISKFSQFINVELIQLTIKKIHEKIKIEKNIQDLNQISQKLKSIQLIIKLTRILKNDYSDSNTIFQSILDLIVEVTESKINFSKPQLYELTKIISIQFFEQTMNYQSLQQFIYQISLSCLIKEEQYFQLFSLCVIYKLLQKYPKTIKMIEDDDYEQFGNLSKQYEQDLNAVSNAKGQSIVYLLQQIQKVNFIKILFYLYFQQKNLSKEERKNNITCLIDELCFKLISNQKHEEISKITIEKIMDFYLK